MITSSIFDRLNTETNVAHKITVVHILQFLITFETGLMGLTVPELLEAFVSQLASPTQDELSNLLFEAVVDAIGALNLHPQYPNQTNDIIIFLVARLNGTGEQSIAFQVAILEALAQTLKASSHVGSRPRTSIYQHSVDFQLFEPLIQLIQSPNPEIRASFYHVLHTLVVLLEFQFKEVGSGSPIEQVFLIHLVY